MSTPLHSPNHQSDVVFPQIEETLTLIQSDPTTQPIETPDQEQETEQQATEFTQEPLQERHVSDLGLKTRNSNKGSNSKVKKLEMYSIKAESLMENLNIIPFIPHKILDFTKHEGLLRKLGLWDFVNVDFDRDLRKDLIAQMVVSYDRRGSYVNGDRIRVNKTELAKTFNIPTKRDKGNVVDETLTDDDIEFMVEFVLYWVLRHEDTWYMPNEVLNWVNVIKGGKPERVDWAGLIWFMVERELVQGEDLRECYYASHLQYFMKEREVFLREEVDGELLEMDCDEEEGDEGVDGDVVAFREDVGVGNVDVAVFAFRDEVEEENVDDAVVAFREDAGVGNVDVAVFEFRDEVKEENVDNAVVAFREDVGVGNVDHSVFAFRDEVKEENVDKAVVAFREDVGVGNVDHAVFAFRDEVKEENVDDAVVAFREDVGVGNVDVAVFAFRDEVEEENVDDAVVAFQEDRNDEGVEIGEEMDAEIAGPSVELTLGQDEGKNGEEIKDEEVMDLENCREEIEEEGVSEQEQWLVNGKNDMGGYFMQHCNSSRGNGTGDTSNGGIEEHEEVEFVEDDEEARDRNYVFPNDDLVGEGLTDNFLRAMEMDQMTFGSQGHGISMQDMDPGPSFLNGSGKRTAEQDDVMLNDSLNHDSNKRMRMNDFNDPNQVNSGTCMGYIQQMVGQASSLYAEKEQEFEQANLSRQILLDELQKRDNMIEMLNKTTTEEMQKRNDAIIRYEKELHVMGNILAGYRKAVKERQKAFDEYREKVKLPEEPAYKDVGGGLMLSTGEIARIRKRQEEEFEMNCLIVQQRMKESENHFVLQFDAFREKVNMMDKRLTRLDTDAKEVFGLYAARKVLKTEGKGKMLECSEAVAHNEEKVPVLDDEEQVPVVDDEEQVPVEEKVTAVGNEEKVPEVAPEASP